MAPTLYMVYQSAPVRAVLMTAKAIGLDLNLKELDIFKGEQLKSAFLKLNPQHTVPTLVDEDDFIIWDSHAIMTYLVSKYAKNDNLYPKDIRKRAVIDQRLHFESGIVFPNWKTIAVCLFRGGVIEEKYKESILEAHSFLEAFIGNNKWVAGDSISIADYSLISSISGATYIVPIDAKKFPKLASWYKRMEELSEYEVNKKGLQMFAESCKGSLGKA